MPFVNRKRIVLYNLTSLDAAMFLAPRKSDSRDTELVRVIFLNINPKYSENSFI